MRWLFLLLVACHEVPASHEAVRASLMAAEGLAAGAGEGLWQWMAEDAAYLHPRAPLVFGRDAAREAMRGVPVARIHRLAGDVSSDGQLGYTFGWFEQDVRPPDARFGRYLATWRRAGIGWQVVGWVRIVAKRPLGEPPPDARIVRGAHGVARPGEAAALAAQAMAADAAFSALSVAQGFSVAFPATAAEDAAVVGPVEVQWNRAGVAKAWEGWTPDTSLAWAPRLGRAAASGDLAFTVGEAVFRKGEERSFSKYLTVWVREADGSWRFLLDGGNARPAG